MGLSYDDIKVGSIVELTQEYGSHGSYGVVTEIFDKRRDNVDIKTYKTNDLIRNDWVEYNELYYVNPIDLETFIPVEANVGDYVKVYWDLDKSEDYIEPYIGLVLERYQNIVPEDRNLSFKEYYSYKVKIIDPPPPEDHDGYRYAHEDFTDAFHIELAPDYKPKEDDATETEQ